MHEPPLLTFITICRNDLTGLMRTCLSLETQSVRETVSHLVIDGASTDSTVEWYQDHKPLPLSCIVSEPDDGIYDAMNKGVRQADAEYVVFLNAGDVLADNEVIGRNLARLQEKPFPWGYGRARVTQAGRQIRALVGEVPYSRWSHLYGRRAVCHQAVIMSRSLIVSLGGFDSSFGLAADYRLLLQAGRAHVPTTWPDVDVEFEAGGATDTDVYRNLVRRHRARVDVEALGRVGARADMIFTQAQTVDVRIRKLIKPKIQALRRLVRGHR